MTLMPLLSIFLNIELDTIVKQKKNCYTVSIITKSRTTNLSTNKSSSSSFTAIITNNNDDDDENEDENEKNDSMMTIVMMLARALPVK